MAQIVLLTGNSLSNNPRAVKEATALAYAGHDVQVIGAWLDPDLKTRDRLILDRAPFRFTAAFDCTRSRLQDITAHALNQGRRKFAHVVHRLTGWESADQLGLGMASLFAHAHSISADLFIAHSEPCLYVARCLMRDGRRVGVDMEDWFSEDMLPQARKQRPLRLLRLLEREMLRGCSYASCPSRAMSAGLAAEYDCKPPTVIYNAFPWAERQSVEGLCKDRRDGAVPSVCWYSQTLGPGRGLEDLVAALPLLRRDVEVHLRGRATPGMEKWLRGRISERYQQWLFFHQQVPNNELLSRIAEHDIGFAGEMKDCRSRDLTITNKILHYLLGGLAVLASDTAGQREVATQAKGAVALCESGNPAALAKTIDAFIESPDRLAQAKAAALQAAERTFCWERQEQALLEGVDHALRGWQP